VLFSNVLRPCTLDVFAVIPKHAAFHHSTLLMKTRIIASYAGILILLLSVCTSLLPSLIPLSAKAQDVFTQNVRIVNPGEPLNHAGLDYAPAISPDGKTLYFVSNRTGSKQNIKGEFSHDFWSALKRSRLDTAFLQPLNMDTTARQRNNGLNTALNEGVPSISANRRVMFFTGCDRPDVIRRKAALNGVKIENDACDIYIVELGENGEWGIPRNLGLAVNSDSWDGQPSVSPDGSRLYFASDRAGGSGEVDIWYTDYDALRKVWQPAKNAGNTINTPFRDWSPFIAANNRELFFASEAGHQPNYGGTDFYVSVRNQKDQWSRPRNLGKPINTGANEAFICTPASRDVLYFASQRTDIPKYQGNYDIFMAFVPQSSLSLALPLQGRVVDGCLLENTAATVSIYNPVTKRFFRDTLDGKKRVSFETVLTDFDFGPLEKPVDTLRLTITAQHAKFGVNTQTLTVIRPKADVNGVYAAMPEIPPVELQYGERPQLFVTLQKNDGIARTATAKLLSSGFQGLAMEEIVSVSVNRILNYVFFDEGSAVIPPRYHVFKATSEANAFDEERLRGETLDKYYHTLNVFGSRLRRFPKATVGIVGCNDQNSPAEKKLTLSKARAQAVFEYLRDVWGISEKRMKVSARDLPTVPSNRDDSLGTEENRRVELLCDEWDIVKPVVDRTPSISTLTPSVSFGMKSPITLENALPQLAPSLTLKTSGAKNQANQPLSSQASVASVTRTLTILRGGMLWRRFTNIATNATISWNWKNDVDDFPAGDTALTAVFSVTDKTGRECFSEPTVIPVRRITTGQKQRDNVSDDKTLERYNLIMFPFDKSDIGPMNSRIIKEYVLPRLTQFSDVDVVGHTDVIGTEEYNLTLSAARGAKAKEEIARLAQTVVPAGVKSLESKGVGEADPLFPNTLPEGRLYNRTVQVIIETPIGNVGKE
jgi:outer membrane protein OmpA-like peptidoglycan-associated protein